MTSLHIKRKTGFVIFVVVVLGWVAYLAHTFNDYLASNMQGICWSEGRKLTPEELHIRVLKTMALKAQDDFDQDPKELSVSYYWRYWKVVTTDAGPETLLKSRLEYASINNSFLVLNNLFGVDKKQLHDDAFYKELIERKFMLSSITYSSPQQGSLWRIGTSRIYPKEEMPQTIADRSHAYDKWKGYGSYYFFLEEISPSDPDEGKRYVDVFSAYYKVNSCANAYRYFQGKSKRYEESVLIPLPSVNSK